MSSYLNIFGENSSNCCTPLSKPSSKSLGKNEEERLCEICYREVNNSESVTDQMLSLEECGHEFCQECWRTHFESVLSSAYTASAFECMQTKCKVVADKDFVLRCLMAAHESNSTGSVERAYKYRCLVATDLVKESEDLQMCPGEKDESENETATSSRIYTSGGSGTPQMTPSSTHSGAPASYIRLVSTISSTPTISFSYQVRNNSISSSTSSSVTSTPHSVTSNPVKSTPSSTSSSRPRGNL